MTARAYISDVDFTLYQGDALEVLQQLPRESVDCVVTSPPYWGLRDYGQEGQIGLENTPTEYVQRLVELFREVRRVLAGHGTVWLNLGDSYNAGRTGGHAGGKGSLNEGRDLEAIYQQRSGPDAPGLKPKDLVGIPWRVAFALQEDGWYLRSDIIWAKNNPMPESIKDRPTKSHEYVFLLAKSAAYFFDQEAVREPAEWNRWGDQTVPKYEGTKTATGWMSAKTKEELNANRSSYKPGQTTGNSLDGHESKSDAGLTVNPAGRNIRSVWNIPTQPYAEAHFATFPEELARRCIAAGCPEQVCRVCGKARERVVEKELKGGHVVPNARAFVHGRDGSAKTGSYAGASHVSGHYEVTTLGFTDCGHSDYRPGIVLDPFIGSGTVAVVARKLDRHCTGIELNADYCELIHRRTQQLSLLA